MRCENCEESAYVIDKMAKLLAEIAVIVNGPEPPLTSWSYHDLPEKVRALKQAPPAQPVAWMSHSALTGQPVFDINPPDESSLAGAIPLFAAPQAPPASVPADGWKEAAIAWEVCASIHRKYAKGRDALFSTRQHDFVAGAEKARAMLAALAGKEVGRDK